MVFQETDSGSSAKGKKESVDRPQDTRARQRLDASLVLLSEFMCSMAADPPEKLREAELIKEAEKKFPEDVKNARRPYVDDRLAVEFPDKFKPIGRAERTTLLSALVRLESLGWKGERSHLATEDQAMLNVMRWYADMPADIRALAEKREVARLKRQDVRAALDIDDNAKLDAWLRLPAGTADARKTLAEKLVKWAKIERGDDIKETVAEKAERLYPGSPAAQKLAIKKLNGGKLSTQEENLLTVWSKDQVPFSDTWRCDEWLAGLKPWQAPADPGKFFDRVRQAKLNQLNGDKTNQAEDTEVLAAYSRFPRNPLAWELYVRSKMAPDADKGGWKKLTAAEASLLKAWDKYTDVWAASSERGRVLEMKDPDKRTKEEDTELRNVRGLENR